MAKRRRDSGLDKGTVLRFLRENPDSGPRDIAREMGLSAAAYQSLRHLLRELRDSGELPPRGKKRGGAAGALPKTTVLEIFGRDVDGEFLCRPAHWPHATPAPSITLLPASRGGGPAPGVGDRVLARLEKREDGGHDARLIKTLGASVHHVLGVLARVKGEIRVRPVDRKSKLELIVPRGDDMDADDGDLVLAAPQAGRVMGLPRARVVERLGPFSAPGAISLIAIHAHGVPDRFPDNVIAEAEGIEPAGLASREDLRTMPLVTIDPEDARDHDDAVWATPDDDPANAGGVIAVVAIADVAAYVRPGSALDREALRRGNSAYFPDRVEPMLPERLSNDLCSLKEGVERPCLAVRMVFDRDGSKLSHRFVRGMMRSAAKLTYSQVQNAIDGKPDDKTGPLLDPILKPLWRAYDLLKRARERRSPLDLSTREHRVKIGPDGRVASITLREQLDSMALIEEFMIQANVAAAETLEKRATPFVYRVHGEPSNEKLESFAAVMRSVGLSFAKGQVVRAATFNRILAQAKDGPYAEMINEITLRTQAQAEYTPENIGHFGLNLARYAHFTSPIRRYADLIVHRALIRALRLGKDGLTDVETARLKDIAAEISGHERRAMAAERDANDRYLTAYLSEHIGAEFKGRVAGVTRFGLFVRLEETGADGIIPIRNLGQEYFRHDEREHALIGERTGLTHRLGDRVTVRLREAAPLTGGLRFDLVESTAADRAPAAKRGAFPPRRDKRRGRKSR